MFLSIETQNSLSECCVSIAIQLSTVLHTSAHDQFKDIMKCMLTFAIALYSESRLPLQITEKKERTKAFDLYYN
jgi:hypothetical protein